MEQNRPTFTISPFAREYIKDAWLDLDRLSEYLDSRGVPESESARLQISIDAPFYPGASGQFSPRDKNSEHSQHLIYLAPNAMLRNDTRRGRLLRHETEHFVYWSKHPNTARNRTFVVGAITTAGAVLGGGFGYEAVSNSIEASDAIEISLSTIGAVGGAALGSFSGFVSSATAHWAIGASEVQSIIAERRHKKSLPDDVLQIELR